MRRASLQAPSRLDFARLRRVVRYMIWTVEYVLAFHYQLPPKTLDAFADSDWAGDSRTRKSCSSGVLKLGAHAVASWSVRQQVLYFDTSTTMESRMHLTVLPDCNSQ